MYLSGDLLNHYLIMLLHQISSVSRLILVKLFFYLVLALSHNPFSAGKAKDILKAKVKAKNQTFFLSSFFTYSLHHPSGLASDLQYSLKYTRRKLVDYTRPRPLCLQPSHFRPNFPTYGVSRSRSIALTHLSLTISRAMLPVL